ncbi:HD domain-containing protein [Patescibacteria group bacterium]|nr:HD domain-containing protein [Patescibacteria group bacterium]
MIIPNYIKNTINTLEKAGFEAYIVGGCVRDLLMEKEPRDWDVTTKARPKEILNLFPDAKYENIFGTVIIPIKDENRKTEHEIEVTTFRSEQGYSDRRHPDEIVFEDDIEKDLSRRDFTVNAIAIRVQSPKSKVQSPLGDIIDLFGGEDDIKKKIIRAVGEPSDRFKEDALRMMRCIRLACQLEFDIEPKTERAIAKLAGAIKFITNERIREELIKILASKQTSRGVMLLHDTKLLQYILPELERGVGVAQDRHHVYTVFKHSILSLKHCPSEDWRVRFAALLHDVAKPQTKKIIKGIATFYNHELVGARMVERIMRRFKFSCRDTEKIVNLVKSHMFYYNVGEVTASSVRRLVTKVGEENLADLIHLRIGDRLGSGVPKAKPYKLRHLEYMLKRVREDPVSVKTLKINGDDLSDSGILRGPKMGAILDILLSEVIDNPDLNNKENLLKRTEELKTIDLDELLRQAKKKIYKKREEDDNRMKDEFWVK